MYTTTLVNLKCILLSERSQTQMAKYRIIPFTSHSARSKTEGTENRSVVLKECRCQKGLTKQGHKGIFRDTGIVSYTTLCVHQIS